MVYELGSTEQIIQFIFDEIEKDIRFIIQKITETKIANQKLLNYSKLINIFSLRLLQALTK